MTLYDFADAPKRSTLGDPARLAVESLAQRGGILVFFVLVGLVGQALRKR